MREKCSFWTDKCRRTGQYTKARSANGYFEGYFNLISLEHQNQNAVSTVSSGAFNCRLPLKREVTVHSYASPPPPWMSPHGLSDQPTDPACSSSGPTRAAGGLREQTALSAAVWAWAAVNRLRTCSTGHWIAEHLQTPVLASGETHSPRLNPTLGALKSPPQASFSLNTGTICGGLDQYV